MPHRVRARAALTALLILLTVAGIHTMGPPGDWHEPVSHAVIVGLVLEVVLAGLLIALRWHHRPIATELAGRLHRMVSAAIVAAMIGALAGIVLSLINNQPRLINLHHAPVVRIRAKPRLRAVSHSQIGWLIRDILIAIVVVAILSIVLRALRSQRRRFSTQLTNLTVDVVTDEDLARAVESGRMALKDLDDARAAIIACYVAMERSLAEAGAARGAAETPDELLARAVNASLVSPGPAGVLTRLFYEARFSTHEMPMSQRDRAERALADIAAELPAGELT
jgi:hypothetical protein